MFLFLVAWVQAHPGGPDSPLIGHRLDLEVVPGTLSFDYVAEVPLTRLVQEASSAQGARPVEALLDDLRAHLRVTWDEETLPITWLPAADSGTPPEPGIVALVVSGRAALPAERGRLTVLNENLPGNLNIYSCTATISGELVVESSSLVQVVWGRLRKNRHGMWLRDEAARQPWLRLRPAGIWESRAEPGPLPERMAGLKALSAPWAWLAGGLALIVAIAAALGVLWGRLRAARSGIGR